MGDFLDRIEPALLSEDPFVQQYVITILEDSFLATPATLFTALQAIDHGRKGNYNTSILPFIQFIPIDEEGLLELLKRIKQNDEYKNWYIRLLENADSELLLKYKSQIDPLVNKQLLTILKVLKTFDEEELYMKLGEIMVSLEENEYNHALFECGKRIFLELAQRGEVEKWEIENGVRINLTEYEYMSFDGIYNVFMAGQQRLESVVPELVHILTKDEGDIVLEEASKALIKIGTDTVVKEVEKVALLENTYFYTIDILAKIKTKSAENTLLRLFTQAEDITAKTLIADALCQHLSIEAIPMVEQLLADGFDETMLNLEESLYANLVLNNINHPDLSKMKERLETEERHFKEIQNKMNAQTKIAKTEKTGRNDPCPCGSGKKYKKCCLK